MKAVALSLEQLKEHLGTLTKPTRPVWRFEAPMGEASQGEGAYKAAALHRLLNRGVPQGSICEFSGPAGCGKTSLIISLLAQHPQRMTCWLQPQWDMGPLPLIKSKIPFQHVVGIETASEWPWATLQVVKSQLFSFVVLSLLVSPALGAMRQSPTKTDEKWLRRMQLACEQSQSTLFLIQDEPTAYSWPLFMQVRMASPSALELLKSRGQI